MTLEEIIQELPPLRRQEFKYKAYEKYFFINTI